MKEKSKSQNKFHVIILEAKAADAPAIARVNVDTWRTTYTGIMPRTYLDSRTYEERTSVWQSRYSDSSKLWHGWFVYVAENTEGEVIGFAGGGPNKGDLPFSGELGFIYLLEAYQHQGIGHQLVDVIVDRLKQQGHNSMTVWVLAANPYRTFYETLGGQIVGEKEVDFGGKHLKEIAYGWHDLSVFGKMMEPEIAIKKIAEGLDCGYKLVPSDSDRCCQNCNNYHPIDKTRGICYEYEVLPTGGCKFYTPKEK